MAGSFLTESTAMEVAVSALTTALQSNTDAVSRLARHTEIQDGKLDKIMEDMADVRTRLTLIERTPISARLDKVEGEVETLKSERFQRQGITIGANALLKYGPFAIAVITAIFVVLVVTRQIVL